MKFACHPFVCEFKYLVRANAGKLIIVLTDGRSVRSSNTISLRLINEGVEIIAVSLKYLADVDELTAIAQNPEHVFMPKNLDEFEKVFLKFVGFGCPGLVLGPESKPRVRGATDITCGPNSVTLTVRTQRPMSGRMYAQDFYDDPKCRLIADGNSRELTLNFDEGNCGLLKTPSPKFDGYFFNLTVILQFHPLIVTRADQVKLFKISF